MWRNFGKSGHTGKEGRKVPPNHCFQTFRNRNIGQQWQTTLDSSNRKRNPYLGAPTYLYR